MKEKGLIIISFISIVVILGSHSTNSIYPSDSNKIDNNLIPLLIPPYKSIDGQANMTKFQNSSLTFVSNMQE
jgi:hypothetical protein